MLWNLNKYILWWTRLRPINIYWIYLVEANWRKKTKVQCLEFQHPYQYKVTNTKFMSYQILSYLSKCRSHKWNFYWFKTFLYTKNTIQTFKSNPHIVPLCVPKHTGCQSKGLKSTFCDQKSTFPYLIRVGLFPGDMCLNNLAVLLGARPIRQELLWSIVWNRSYGGKSWELPNP